MPNTKLCTVVVIAMFALSSRVVDAQIRTVGKRRTDKVEQAAKSPVRSEIRCRGGEEAFRFDVVEQKSQLPTGETPIVLALRFTPASGAAGAFGQGLAAGTCAFIDRPLTSQESPIIQFETVSDSQRRQALHGSAIDDSPTAAERFADAMTIPGYLTDSNHYWSFFGAYDASNNFIAAAHSPWRRETASAQIEGQARVSVPPMKNIGGLRIEGKARQRGEIREKQPRNSIFVEIRYNKNYGIGIDEGAFGKDPHSCFDFVLSIRPWMHGDPPKLIGTPTSGPRGETATEYVCAYTFTSVPLDMDFTVAAAVPDPASPWSGGTETQPPAGQQRTVLGSPRTVRLTAAMPKVAVSFEMIYSVPPQGPR